MRGLGVVLVALAFSAVATAAPLRVALTATGEATTYTWDSATARPPPERSSRTPTQREGMSPR